MRVGSDEAKIKELLQTAHDGGINYIDTAYIYVGNEAALGKGLAALNLRDKFNIATKLPPYFVKTIEDAERILATSLSRLQTDYVDYYLLHMLASPAEWQRLCELGIREWIAAQKQSGRIRNIGFSYHGNTGNFKDICDVYDWDFTMIQYNYVDEHTQAGRGGLDYAVEKGIPVIIMEPLRGGHLTKKLPKSAVEIFREADASLSPARWALRWLWNQPGVMTVLSGMKTPEELAENIDCAKTSSPEMLTAEEIDVYTRVTEKMRSENKVPCTVCNYCLPCPRGVDIPMCFDAYNLLGKSAAIRVFYILRNADGGAGKCNSCGLCRSRCPQSIDIPAELRRVRRGLEGPLYKIIRPFVRWIRKI